MLLLVIPIIFIYEDNIAKNYREEDVLFVMV